MQYEYQTFDVFTDTRFGGNPLAVVLNADGLDDAAMQRIAAEFNYSETCFVLPPADTANTARVRIFTPRAELPFAGHPNVGTGFCLARQAAIFGGAPADRMVFEEGIGSVQVEADRSGDQVIGARVRSPQLVDIGAELSPEMIAACCGLNVSAFDVSAHPPVLISCGNPFAAVCVETREALAEASGRAEAFTRALPADLAAGLLLYVKTPDGDADVRVRVFGPLHGIPEDPATGSANIALVGLLALLDERDDVSLRIDISQGREMGRPSRLVATAVKNGGRIVDSWIGGACVPVMTGTLDLG